MTTCDICGYVVLKNSLKNHRSKHTDPDSLMTTCDICREIVRKDCLNEHHLTHTDPDSLMTTCDICGVKIRKSSLKQHKNGFLCLYDRDVSYKWENVGKNIAEIVLTGQDWKWKPKILLKKLKPSLSVDQRVVMKM